MGSSKCRCTIFVGAVLSGVYATAAYLAACCMEIGWLVEYDGLLPAPSFILAGAYFFTLLVSAVLLVGIARKKTRFLLVWLFFMGIIFLPECGLVLYVSLRFWSLSHSNGITELSFYICRAIINVLAFVCIQTLLRRWRQEKAVMRRLEFLNIGGSVFRETNGGLHHKHDMEYNGHGSTVAYANPLPIESELYGSPKHLARSPSNMGTRPQVIIPYTNGSVPPTSPRDLFHARASSYWNTSKSEFDAASFTDFIVNRPRPLSELGNSRSHNDLPTTVFSVEGGWDRGDTDLSELGYATQSLERPRFRQHHYNYNNNLSRRTRSLEEVNRTTPPHALSEVFLEKMEERPFQYLQRPGVFYRDESEASDTHSIRDIAL